MRILLIVDDPIMAHALDSVLRQAGYGVRTAPSAPAGLGQALSGTYALIILDLTSPGLSGLAACRDLKAYQKSCRCGPPVLLIASREDVEDLAGRPEAGGTDFSPDDYLPTPFPFGELLSRVHALVCGRPVRGPQKIQIGQLEIIPAERRITRGGSGVPLTRREYALLASLALNEGLTVDFVELQERAWLERSRSLNALDACVSMLRRKIESGHQVPLIEMVPGFGYKLTR